MSRTIFISHRHADKAIADSLNAHLQRWQVRKDEIFQSSHAEGGPKLGGKLNRELLRALSEVRLLLLVYTKADANWSYCLWECGVAVDPNHGDTPTRIVVFRATDLPPVLDDLVSVNILVEDEVKRFVHQFFKEKEWVKEGVAFNAEVADAVLDDYAIKLHTTFREVWPTSKAEEKYRWDLFTLRFDASNVKEITKQIQKAGYTATTFDLVQKTGKVAYDFGEALVHFGYTAKSRDLTFSQLIQRWSQEVPADAALSIPNDWIKELCEEIMRAIENRPAKPAWAMMHSSQYPGWWFYPVVNHQRIEVDGSMDFDIYLYRVPGILPAKVDLPDVPPSMLPHLSSRGGK
jgi:TIR domain